MFKSEVDVQQTMRKTMWSLDTAPLTSLEKMYKYTFSFDTRTDVKLKNWHTVWYISSVVYYIYVYYVYVYVYMNVN